MAKLAMAGNVGTEEKTSSEDKARKKADQKSSKVGKVANTDNYGEGGNGATPAVPGKTSGTENLPAGANGQGANQQASAVGKQNGVGNETKADGGEGGKEGGKNEGKNAGGTGVGGLGDKEAKQAGHDAAAGAKKGAANAKAPGGGDKGKKGGADGAAAQGKGGGAAKEKVDVDGGGGPAPAARNKVVAPPVQVVIPGVTSVKPVDLVLPPVSKSVVDKWIKETGRAPDAHHAQIQGALGELQSEVQNAQNEFIALSDQLQAKVKADVAAKIATFTSSITSPGRQRVANAYAGITKTLDTSTNKALQDVTQHKMAGLKAILAATPAKKAELTKKIDGSRGVVEARVKAAAPAASKVIQQYAADILPKIDQVKEACTKKATAEADKFDPKAASTGDKRGDSAVVAGRLSLRNDVYNKMITDRGAEVAKEYDDTLRPVSVEIDNKAELWVRDALKESSHELNTALDMFKDTGVKAIQRTSDESLKDLVAQEASAKKGISDAKAESAKKLESEKKASLDTADKAAKELSDNSTAAGTEFADRIKLRAAEDAKGYARITASLEVTLKKRGPHKFEAIKPQIDAARAQLAEMHNANKAGLNAMLTSGMTDLTNTLTTQQTIYQTAIKDREDAAVRCDGEIKQTIAKGANDLGANVANIGLGFDKTLTRETGRVDGALGFFKDGADKALADFSRQIGTLIQGTIEKAGAEFSKAQATTFQEQVEKAAEKELQTKEGKLITDAGTIRSSVFDGPGTEESQLFGILRKCSYGEIELLQGLYNCRYDNRGKGSKYTPLQYDMDDELSGSEWDIAFAYVRHQRDDAVKLELKEARRGGVMGTTDASRVEAVLRSCSDKEIKTLTTNPEAKQILLQCRMGTMDKCNLDTMDALLDTSQKQEDRVAKANAIQLFKAMKGNGTDEAKMTEILEGAATEKDRERLRAQFNEYAAARGWDKGNPKDPNDDALTRAIKDDCEDGERHEFLELARVKRNEQSLKTARMIKAADGGGTDENLLFDALDDKDYAKAWAEAAGDEDKQKKLEKDRKDQLAARMKEMGSGYASPDKLIEGETTKGRYTWSELLKGEKGGKPLDVAKEKKRLRGACAPAEALTHHLEYMVAERKLQTGQCEPELLIAYACWGEAGTNEELINKALSDGGEPLPFTTVEKINNKFFDTWGIKLVDQFERVEQKMIDKPGGLLRQELSGKDWFKTRILLAGQSTNISESHFVNNLQFGHATSGVLGGVFMKGMEFVGLSEAQSTAEHTMDKANAMHAEAKQEGYDKTAYTELQKQADAAKKEMQAGGVLPGTSRKAIQLAAAADMFQLQSKFVEGDSKALAETKAAFVEAIVMIVEMIGAALITVGTGGAAGPALLAFFLKNLALSAATMTFKALVLGDQYGEGDIATDGVAAIGNAAFNVAGELKMVGKLADNIGAKVTGKFFTAAEEGVERAGMRIVHKNGQMFVELSAAGIKRVENIISAGAKNVMMETGQEIFNTLTNEKTYDMKVDEALFGENSLGKRILMSAPKAFATGAVSQWINEASENSTPDFPKGKKRTPANAAMWNAIAEAGGEAAGFFVYLDNYNDAEHFWINLFKATAKSAVSGGLSGYNTHKKRAHNLAGDFMADRLDVEGANEWFQKLDEVERKKFAEAVMRYGSDENKAKLPDAYKQVLNSPAKPVADANAATTQQPADANATAGATRTTNGGASDNAPIVKSPVADNANTKPKPIGDDAAPKVKPKDAASVDDDSATKKVDDKPVATKTDDDHAKEAQARKDGLPPNRDTLVDQQKLGHAGIEVHSHFLGNVDPSTFAERILNSGVKDADGNEVGMRKGNPAGTTVADKVGDVSGYEPMLREILGLEHAKDANGNNAGFGHKYKTDETGKPVTDADTNKPVIETRGKTGDAIQQAKEAEARITVLKARLLDTSLSKGEQDAIRREIKKEAKSAVDKAMRASDDTDFNSSYEIRDELIKKFYGEADRRKMLEDAGVTIAGDAKALPDIITNTAEYREHFAKQGRLEVVKRIDDAKFASDLLKSELAKPADQQNKDFIKQQQAKIDAASQNINEQFAYDKFAKDTILRLVKDGLMYTEQSNSSKKLAERFDPMQLDALKSQLAAEHPDLADKILAFEVKHVAMINTNLFGKRGNLDTAGNQTLDQGDLHKKSKETGSDADFDKAVKQVVEQTKRGDVVGVDIAGAEHFTFDQAGADRFKALHAALVKAARDPNNKGGPIVLRPHVGEGANDTTEGKHFGRDSDRQMDGGDPSHYKRAKDNLDALLITLDDIAFENGGKLPPEVVVRFGHATHTTADQAQLMAKLGIIAEVNLSSNIETGSVSQKDPKNSKDDRKRSKDDPHEKHDSSQDRGGRLDDHSLATLIMNDVPIILSTDGHSVMSTSMKREYQLANATIDKILRSRQGIPMTAQQAAALGVPGIDVKKGGNVVVKLNEIPREHQGAIIEKFSKARGKFFDDAQNYYDSRPKQKTDPNDPPPPDGDNVAMGASMDHGGSRKSVSDDNLTAEKNNKPAISARANAALEKLPKADRDRVQKMLDETEPGIKRTMMDRALAAGRTADDLAGLQNALSVFSDEVDIAKRFTGAGVVQFFDQSCLPTSYQIALADMDPLYAWHLRQDPRAQMDQQQAALKSAGGAQTMRKEIAGGDQSKLPADLASHMEEADMKQKLMSSSQYDANGTQAGIAAKKMEGTDLHKQLEQVTGYKYDVLVNDAAGKTDDDHASKFSTQHTDRIIAALDLNLPVIVGEVKGKTDDGKLTGHARTIVGYKRTGEGDNERISFMVRDPWTGTVQHVSMAGLELAGGLGNITVPRVPVPKKKPAVADTAKKPVASDGTALGGHKGDDADQQTGKKKPATDEDAAKKKATDEDLTKKPVKEDPPIDPAHKPTDKQLAQGHAGIEVHSHFMGNVPTDTMKKVVGARVPKVAGQESEWEPILHALNGLDKHAEGKTNELSPDQLRHGRNADNKIVQRGKSGDALDLVKTAINEISVLKTQLVAARMSGNTGEVQNLLRQIDGKAQSAVKKALETSDETDFNSSYELRDELIKKFYGDEQRNGVLVTGTGKIDIHELMQNGGKLEAHFAGRPEVLERIKKAKALAVKEALTESEIGELKALTKNLNEQFAYDQYAKEAIKRLAEDNLSYTEQSNSSKKMADRFDPGQFEAMREQLVAELQKKLKIATDLERPVLQKKIDQLNDLQIANLTMVNTGNFGERDQVVKADGEYQDPKRSSIEDFKKKDVKTVVDQVKNRNDTAGVDIAGPENFRFDEGGQARMRILYDELAKVGTPDKPVVLRPHVGEGAWDPKKGEQGHKNDLRETADGELLHYERARHNIESMLKVFEDIAAANNGTLPKNVIVRFGHVTHATPEQTQRMADLGIIAEINLTSNLKTGALKEKNPANPTDGPERFEDHSLTSLIKAGAPVILSTDAHEVMNTDLKQEYDHAQKIIKAVVSGDKPLRVSATEAEQYGVVVNPGPPPHGLVYYKQLPDLERKRFDNALEKLYADANKYYAQRPKRDDGPPPPPSDTTPASTDRDDVAKAKQKAQTKEQLQPRIDKLGEEMGSDDVYTRTRAQSDLELLMTHPNPEIADAAKLKGAYITAKKHQPDKKGNLVEGPDVDLLSNNIDALKKQQDLARTGKDPELQKKRETFENTLAREILKPGPIREKVDAELARLSNMALEYVMRTRTTPEEQAKAFAAMGTEASKGYGGGLSVAVPEGATDAQKNQIRAQNAAKVVQILQEGNIRERMMALSNFMEKVLGDDALNKNEGGAEKLKAAADGKAGAFSAEAAKKVAARAAEYSKLEKNAEDRKARAMFGPTAKEGQGDLSDYAYAKSQDMDTKFPVLRQDAVDKHLDPTKDRTGDMTLAKGGEESPIARNMMTVKEANEKLGLNLSKEEIAAAGGENAPLNWVIGQVANMINPAAPFVAEANNLSMPLKSGVSGTTYRWMKLVDVLGGDPNLARLAAVASLQASDAHSFHEIAVAAKGFGVEYDVSNPYGNIGISKAELDAIAAKAGVSLDEINGKPTNGGKD